MPSLAATHQRFELLIEGFAFFKALVSALELGLFESLFKAPQSGQELSRELDLPRESVELLIHSLSSFDLLELREDKVYLTRFARTNLCEQSPHHILPIIRAYDKLMYTPFDKLSLSLKHRTNEGLSTLSHQAPSNLYEVLEHNQELRVTFYEWMACLRKKYLNDPRILSSLKSLISPEDNILELGGGECLLYQELTTEKKPMHWATIDLNISSRPCQNVRYIKGNFFDVDYPKETNTILLSNIVSIYSSHKIKQLYKKCFNRLPRGGKLLIIEGLNDLPGTTLQAFLSLYFLCVATGEGKQHSLNQHRTWLTSIGFDPVVHSFEKSPWVIIVALKN